MAEVDFKRIRRIWRRRFLLPLAAATLGGILVLLFEWFVIRPKPVHTPQLIAANAKTNPCDDLHSYICSSGTQIEDPTGDVRIDAEGEVEVLRLYENIIRKNRRLNSHQIDELLVREVYSSERVKKIRVLFEHVRDALLLFVETQPLSALSAVEKQVLRSRIQRVRLELPPPASVYDDERDLFTKNDVYYERLGDGTVRIRIGGALLYSVRSQFNLAFTLAHELGHAIDPCELRTQKFSIRSYDGLAKCFGTPTDSVDLECSRTGKLAEIFADWVATNVVADLLVEYETRFTALQMRQAAYNSVRDLCYADVDEFGYISNDLASAHPSGSYRVNRIFAQHPRIRGILGCAEESGPTLPGVPSHCFWSSKGATR